MIVWKNSGENSSAAAWASSVERMEVFSVKFIQQWYSGESSSDSMNGEDDVKSIWKMMSMMGGVYCGWAGRNGMMK